MTKGCMTKLVDDGRLVTRAAENAIMHQSDLAVHENQVGTKVSTNQKHQNVEYQDGKGSEAPHPY